MKKKVEEFLKNNQFKLVEKGVDLYTNDLESEYFIIEQYNLEELVNFFDDEKTEKIIKDFEDITQKGKYKNIKKNTSLLILVEVDNLKDGFEDEKTRKAIFLVEEDYYYFRKFVLLYSQSGLSELRDKCDNIELYNYLEKGINEFEKDMFYSDAYFMAMELGVKMPFFTLPNKYETYQSIESQYSNPEKERIDDICLNLYLNNGREETGQKNRLVESLINVKNNDTIISELMKIFK